MTIQASKIFNKKTLMTLFVVVGIAASLFLNWGEFVNGLHAGFHAGR